MADVMLGGIPLAAHPNEIRWNFKMKTSETKTMGGKVIQILGTTLSDLTVAGSYGRGQKAKGDTEGWQDQLRFNAQVKKWATRAASVQKAKPLRFVYAPRGWDFNVFIKAFSPTRLANEEINPKWQLTLFPVDEGAMTIVSGIKDLYIARLMDGVGWKQTDYNGPTQEEVDATLSPFGGSVEDFYRDRFSTAFEGGVEALSGAGGTTARPQ